MKETQWELLPTSYTHLISFISFRLHFTLNIINTSCATSTHCICKVNEHWLQEDIFQQRDKISIWWNCTSANPFRFASKALKIQQFLSFSTLSSLWICKRAKVFCDFHVFPTKFSTSYLITTFPSPTLDTTFPTMLKIDFLVGVKKSFNSIAHSGSYQLLNFEWKRCDAAK